MKVDLEKRRDVHWIFQGNLDSKTLLSQLSVAFGRHIVPGETLLFLDEIQTCPRALMALRYLYEEVPAPPATLPEVTHRVLMEHLRNYFFVGGMPEAVVAFGDGAS